MVPTVRLICPACGAAASLEAWAADGEARAAMVALLALPPEVGRVMPGYLGLFRPAKNALSWVRVGRIVGEVAGLVGVGEVSRAEGCRPCPPALWGKAMEQMLAQREKVKTPLGNHNYLVTIAWAMADEAAAKAETRQGQQLASHSSRAEVEAQRDPRMARARAMAMEAREAGEAKPLWEIIATLAAGGMVMGRTLEEKGS